MKYIPTPFRWRLPQALFRIGVVASTIIAIFVALAALYFDEFGHFTDDHDHLLEYVLICVILVIGPFLFFAIVAEIVIGRNRRARHASQPSIVEVDSSPSPSLILTRIVACIGVLAGSVMALIAGLAALSHNPQRTISDDPVYLMMIMFSWFVVWGGPLLLLSAAIEVIYRIYKKFR